MDLLLNKIKTILYGIFPTLEGTYWVFLLLFISISMRLGELSVLFVYILFAKKASAVIDDMLGSSGRGRTENAFSFCNLRLPCLDAHRTFLFTPYILYLFCLYYEDTAPWYESPSNSSTGRVPLGSPVFNGDEIPETGSGSSKYRVSAFNDTTHTHFHHKLSGPQFERYMAYLEQRERNNYKLRVGGLCVTAVACVGLACAGAYVFTSRFPVSPLPKEAPKEYDG